MRLCIFTVMMLKLGGAWALGRGRVPASADMLLRMLRNTEGSDDLAGDLEHLGSMLWPLSTSRWTEHLDASYAWRTHGH